MQKLHKKNGHKLRPMFTYTHLTMVQSYLDGFLGMGWVDNPQAPTCAQIIVGDCGFIAGDHTAPDAISLVENIPANSSSDFILVAENEGWQELIFRRHSGKAQRSKRYAFHHQQNFPLAKLSQYAQNPPPGYQIKPLDQTLYYQCLDSPLQDLCCNFRSADDYIQHGLGFCALKEGEIAAGASSYTFYKGGIEIEVDSGENHRRQGLALCCSANLILACLQRGLYPSWDAANPESCQLAQKLGYVFSHAYEVCLIER